MATNVLRGLCMQKITTLLTLKFVKMLKTKIIILVSFQYIQVTFENNGDSFKESIITAMSACMPAWLEIHSQDVPEQDAHQVVGQVKRPHH